MLCYESYVYVTLRSKAYAVPKCVRLGPAACIKGTKCRLDVDLVLECADSLSVSALSDLKKSLSLLLSRVQSFRLQLALLLMSRRQLHHSTPCTVTSPLVNSRPKLIDHPLNDTKKPPVEAVPTCFLSSSFLVCNILLVCNLM